MATNILVESVNRKDTWGNISLVELELSLVEANKQWHHWQRDLSGRMLHIERNERRIKKKNLDN